MKTKHRFLRIFFILGAFALISFFAMLSSNSGEHIRAVDAFRLVGIGMCLGGAIISLVAYFQEPGSLNK